MSVENGIQHNCALVGISLKRPSKKIGPLVVNAVDALQHRGEEAAGIAWSNTRGEIKFRKDLGLRSLALPDKFVFNNIPATQIAMGHTRYSTSGSGDKNKERRSKKNVQPFVFREYNFAIEQNGTVWFDYPITADEPNSDTYKVGKAIVEGGGDLIENIQKVLSELNGAYVFLFHTGEDLLVASDPWRFRPGVIGKLNNDVRGIAVASETVGLKKINAEIYGTLKRGVLAKITPYGLEEIWKDPRADLFPEAKCSFETAYFADATSETIRSIDAGNPTTNHEVRVALGKRLAERARPQGDCVVAVPQSGWSYAEGIGQVLDLRLDQAIHNNRYKGRAFIKSESPEERMKAAFLKYNFVSKLIRDRDLIVVDDSIVRGNTTQGLILALFKQGANRIELLSGIPPIVDPCYWGIDFKNPKELIYNALKSKRPEGIFEEELALWLVGGDEVLARRLRVSFQDVDDYKSIIGEDHCFHCVSGDAPVGTQLPIAESSL